MSGRRWQDVPEADRDYVTRAVLLDERDRVLRARACCDRLGGCPAEDAAHRLAVHDRRIAALDAALARLAEPAQPSAAERWRAVPERAREATLAQLDLPRSQCFGGDRNGVPYAERVEAERALLALARDAEGTPAPAEPAPPTRTRTPCHRCGKPLARRGVYHVCPHRVPCGSSGWCRACATRSGT